MAGPGCALLPAMTVVSAERSFDGEALLAEVDARRAHADLSWVQVANALTDLSAQLRAEIGDHAVCPGALQRTVARGTMSCQYALMLLQWLDRAPEDFLACASDETAPVPLPDCGPDERLRWDLPQLYDAVDEQRRDKGLTWRALAAELGTAASRLTNLRHARQADMELTMRLTQWLGRPAATFVHPATW